MKRIFSILFVLALVLGFNLVAATPAAAATINVPGDHTTIQAAVSASSSGDTIKVASGTYNEGIITINHDLKIIGATTPSKPVINPTTDTGTANVIGPTGRGWFQITGATVILRNLVFDGAGKLIHTAVHYHGDSTGGTVKKCDFKNIAHNPTGYDGRGINNYGQYVEVLNCKFSNIYRIGVFTYNEDAQTLIRNCTYTGKGTGDWLDYAFEAGNGGTITVERCTATDCKGVATVDGSTSAGILVTTYYGPSTKATITCSKLSKNTGGIAVGYDETDTSVVEAHHNRIVGNTSYGIDSTAPSVDAENNWWGDASGPSGVGTGSGDAVSANVNYTPWLTSKADLLCRVVNVHVKDSNSKPLVGAPVKYKLGGYTYDMGTTDASGHISQNFTLGTTDLEVWAYWNNTESPHQTQDISKKSNFTFQTVEVTLRLETCLNAPLDGGKARFKSGDYTYWFPDDTITLTGSSNPGEVAGEIFPGTYSFEMMYKPNAYATAEVKPNEDIVGNTTLVWQTTKVTMTNQYGNGKIRYGGPDGTYEWFNSPEELLPGTYWFEFNGAGKAQLTFSGCDYTCKVIANHLLHPVQYRFGAPAPGYSFAAWPPIFESWTDVRIQNDSAQDASNVKAWISDAPPHVTIVDGAVSIASIPSGGGSAWSSDTYTLKVDMSMGVDPSLGVTWTIEADDAGGTHYIFFNVPQ